MCAQRRRARRGRSVRTELERVHIDTLVLVTRRLLRPHLRARGDRRRQCERSCVRRLTCVRRLLLLLLLIFVLLLLLLLCCC